MAVKTSVELSGPFFQRDPAQTFSENIKRALEGFASEGQKVIASLLMSGAGGREPIYRLSPDRVADHVVGRVQSLTGREWRATAVVSVNNSGLSADEGISLMAAASSLERRLGAFRKATRASRLTATVVRANLTKGIE